MKQYAIEIESVSPIIFTKMLTVQKEQREKHDEFDKRIWREKAHITDDGQIKIPGVMFKRALESAAKYLKEKIPGQRMATYSKPFLSAVQVLDDIVLPVTKEQVQCVDINCNADGRRGSGTRVVRRFPIVTQWAGTLNVIVCDEAITQDVLIRHVKAAGMFIGIGGFRVEVGNQGGRFKIKTDGNGDLLVRASEFEI